MFKLNTQQLVPLLTTIALPTENSPISIILWVLGSILTFTGIISLIIKIGKNWKQIKTFLVELCCCKVSVMHKTYYSTEFLVNNIKKAKSEVVIFCVKNARVTEADVIKAVRNFCCDRNGIFEVYSLKPDMTNDIVERIMKTLPAAPDSVDLYRQEVDVNKKKYNVLHNDMGEDAKRRLKYYEYTVLPTMHFCIFDKKIYLGFQVFDDRDDIKNTDSLLDSCMIINTKSKLGKMIKHQLECLKEQNNALCPYL
ncbi:hypothetical protein AGMMS50268_34270 [Spirochaetia bacterium]|nr:hypothetical protein AGMMS50268_34270 [Spirochaetia bacterium]